MIVNGVNGEFGPNAVQLVMVGKASGQEGLKFNQEKEDWNAKVSVKSRKNAMSNLAKEASKTSNYAHLLIPQQY